MTLLTTVRELIAQEGVGKRIAFTLCVITAWELLLPLFQQRLQGDDGEMYRILVGVWFCIGPKVTTWSQTTLREIASKISGSWKTVHWRNYYASSYETRMSIEPESVSRQMERAGWSIFNVVEWGVPSITGVLASIIGSFYIFVSNGLTSYMFGCIIINILSYNLLTKEVFRFFFKRRNEIREDDERLRSNKQMSLPRLQYRNEEPEVVSDIELRLEVQRMETIGLWQSVNLRTQLTNGALIMIIIYFNRDIDIATFFLIMGSLRSFSSSLSQSMTFMNGYSDMEESFVSFEQTVEKCSKDAKKGIGDVEKQDLPDSMVIPAQTVEHDFKLEIQSALLINKGGKYLIRGPSASGKSTLISTMLGEIVGLTILSSWTQMQLSPSAYCHNAVKFFQSIMSVIPTSVFSIRQLFYNEQDDTVIQECLDLARAAEWAHKLKPVKKKPKVYPEWTIHGVLLNAIGSWIKESRPYMYVAHQLKFGPKVKTGSDEENQTEVVQPKIEPKINPFDIPIKERHSGGEKARLMLAILIYKLIKLIAEDPQAHRMFVLDEPEQGIDPPMAYEIIEAIQTRFPTVTIVVISHLERIHKKLKWDAIWSVDKGVVKVAKTL